MLEQRNKEIVQQYFDGWRNGTGNAFDLLAPEATWTITGTGATAGTYRKQELLDQVVNPTSARLPSPIVPTVRGIWADDDMVIVLWNGEAVEALAFLDMQEFNNLWTRVSPRN